MRRPIPNCRILISKKRVPLATKTAADKHGLAGPMASLTVHVLDRDKKPVSGKNVFCNFRVVPAMHSTRRTDDEGVAEFDDIPVCTIEVYVNGELQIEVGVGYSEHEEVTVTI